MSSVFDYVYAFETINGIKGIVRADDIKDAEDRVLHRYGLAKVVVLMDDLDNDYGAISQIDIDEALKNKAPVHQYSFDIVGRFDESDIRMCLEERFGAEVLGVEWKARWERGDYEQGKPPISSN